MDPDYSPDILDAVSGGVSGELTEDEDDLFRDAVEAVVAAKQASVSMLQRRFRIGYNRAARLVDMMEERGMVAPSDGTNKPRKVLLTEEGLGEYLSGGAGDARGLGDAGGASAAPRVSAPDVSGAQIAPVSHAVYGGIPGGEPAGVHSDDDDAGVSTAPEVDPDAEEDIYIRDLSDLIGDDDPPFVADDE
jgi:predicted transcriptional regulator